MEVDVVNQIKILEIVRDHMMKFIYVVKIADLSEHSKSFSKNIIFNFSFAFFIGLLW